MKNMMAIPKSWAGVDIRCTANGWIVSATDAAMMGSASLNEARVYDDIRALTEAVRDWAMNKWDREG